MREADRSVCQLLASDRICHNMVAANGTKLHMRRLNCAACQLRAANGSRLHMLSRDAAQVQLAARHTAVTQAPFRHGTVLKHIRTNACSLQMLLSDCLLPQMMRKNSPFA